jgi:hypothetical protein
MFDNNDTVFINWIENLEAKCQELIFNKGDNWFETKLDKDDIESAFTSPFKIYKSGKFYLLRVNVKPNIKIFNDDKNIINLDDFTNDKNLISIIEIQGIKFTSRNFQIEIELKQSMIVSPDPFLDDCFIKQPVKTQSSIVEEIDVIEDVGKDEDNLFIHSIEPIEPILIDTQSFSNIDRKIDVDIDKKTEMNTAINSKTTSPISNTLLNTDIVDIKLEDILDDDSENIFLDIEDLTVETTLKEDPNVLKEFDLSSSNLENNLETITLKKPNQVYYEIYKKAREKAKEAKKEAILAFLEAKNIKKTYMLDDIDESEDESDNEDLNFDEIEDI